MSLKKLRIKKGLSQAQLAKVTTIPLSTIIKYEDNYANINRAKLENLLKICIALGCRVEDIITEDSLKEILSKYNKER